MMVLEKQRQVVVCEFQAILAYIVRSCTKGGEAEPGRRRKGGQSCMFASAYSLTPLLTVCYE